MVNIYIINQQNTHTHTHTHSFFNLSHSLYQEKYLDCEKVGLLNCDCHIESVKQIRIQTLYTANFIQIVCIHKISTMIMVTISESDNGDQWANVGDNEGGQ